MHVPARRVPLVNVAVAVGLGVVLFGAEELVVLTINQNKRY
jgi:hypothetical protein